MRVLDIFVMVYMDYVFVVFDVDYFFIGKEFVFVSFDKFIRIFFVDKGRSRYVIISKLFVFI